MKPCATRWLVMCRKGTSYTDTTARGRKGPNAARSEEGWNFMGWGHQKGLGWVR